jgi:hypothetical protein
MSLAAKIVLRTPLREPHGLADLVARCLRDRVGLIVVVGDDCEGVHDAIDEILDGDGTDGLRFIVTTWHDGESLEEAIQFASSFYVADGDRVELVEL